MKMKQNATKFTENNERNLKSSWHKMPTSKNQDNLILNSIIYLKSLENQKKQITSKKNIRGSGKSGLKSRNF